jgi:hypothetical protein
MTPIEPKWVLQAVEALFGSIVATVGEPPPSLKERGGPQETSWIPPVARAGGGAAEAENALVIAVEFATLLT